MITKSVSPVKKVTKRKASVVSEVADRAAVLVQESAQPVAASSANIDSEVRRQLVAAEAYFIAERRGFEAGHEIEDWMAAEVLVDSRIHHPQIA
jgi:hypothetical protein